MFKIYLTIIQIQREERKNRNFSSSNYSNFSFSFIESFLQLYSFNSIPSELNSNKYTTYTQLNELYFKQ
jgi:hypothetical protein